MVTLAPDVYIVKYLTATNQLTEEIKNKALEFINAGYYTFEKQCRTIAITKDYNISYS